MSLSACGGSGGGVLTDVEIPIETNDVLTDEILEFDAEVADLSDDEVVDDAVPEIDEPVVVISTSFQSLKELQENGAEVVAALGDGVFSGSLLTNEQAPGGRAFYDGLMTVRRVDGFSGSPSEDFVSGQMNLTIPFGGGEEDGITGLARSFVYFPAGSNILTNTDGARSVLGTVGISGDVVNTSTNPSGLLEANLNFNGSITFPEDLDDTSQFNVSVRGTSTAGFVDGGFSSLIASTDP